MSEQTIDKISYDKFQSDGKLVGARCQNCSALYLPPRPMCTACYGDELAWEELSGKGKLAAFTTIHIGPEAMIAAGYDRNNPYCSGIVQLHEGPAISAQIVGVDPTKPEEIQIGLPLQVVWVTRGDGDETFLAFQPAEG